jgi:hypothetical protein
MASLLQDTMIIPILSQYKRITLWILAPCFWVFVVFSKSRIAITTSYNNKVGLCCRRIVLLFFYTSLLDLAVAAL